MMSSTPPVQDFKRVLVANRGEIAVRIIRTLREMGIESVALFAAADQQSLHVRMADYAVKLCGHSLQDTYLNIAQITEAASFARCDGVHPGYGFLAENPDFVSSLQQLPGVRFIGPSAQAMSALGDKVKARALAARENIPILPGCSTVLKSFDELREVSETIGFPLVMKAAAGGGGKGMRIVEHAAQLEEAYRASQRESSAFFGSSDVYCERYLQKPRHIEFQTLFDHHGAGVHVFERDCSVQRRYQKLFEEAPSQYLSAATRAAMGDVAVKLGLAAQYTGAATVEFICEDPQTFYFMEMNTRIQVEHPVTEMITGVDLIRETIRIAAYHPLPFKQEELSIRGHAMEVRINAEDPTQDFAPSGGRCEELHWPAGPFVRVDSHIAPGYVIPDLYDSMIAKIIVWAPDRCGAIERMKRALGELRIGGVTTTALFHEALLHHPLFASSELCTTFIEQQQAYFCSYYASGGAAMPDEATDDADVMKGGEQQGSKARRGRAQVEKRGDEKRGNKKKKKTQGQQFGGEEVGDLDQQNTEEQDILLAVLMAQELCHRVGRVARDDRLRWQAVARRQACLSSEEH